MSEGNSGVSPQDNPPSFIPSGTRKRRPSGQVRSGGPPARPCPEPVRRQACRRVGRPRQVLRERKACRPHRT